MKNNSKIIYDVAISYATEDREHAASLADILDSRGIKVFYDEYEEASTWGKNLYTHLSEIYHNLSYYCVIFISKNYSKKLWTNHEREAAQARAFQENREYILPIRLDDTEIEGVLPTIHFLRWPPENAESVADKIMVKLGKSNNIELLSFYKARQEVLNLSYKTKSFAKLLSARTLATLYFKRREYSPSAKEKEILFHNLLLQGRGMYHGNRGKKSDSETAKEYPASLGWYWFKDMKKADIVSYVKVTAKHGHIHARAGAFRALSYFAEKDDKVLILGALNDNANVAAHAIRAMSRIGTDEDFERLRGMINDPRPEVRGAIVYAMAYTKSDINKQAIIDLLEDSNSTVRVDAITSLGIRAIREREKEETISILQSIANNLTLGRHIVAMAKKVLRVLNDDSYYPLHSYDGYIKKMSIFHGLQQEFSETSKQKAIDLLFFNPSASQEAGIRWIVKYAPHEALKIIDNYTENMHFRVLQRLDYYLYCPQFWRNLLDPTDLQRCINERRGIIVA